MKNSINADLVLINGKIITVDPQDTIAEAVAVKYDKILAVGRNEKIKPLVGPETKVIDLEGKMVCPGFIDSHLHPPGAGISLLYEVNCRDCKSIEELLEKIRERVEKAPKGTWIRASRFNEFKVTEKRRINRWDLDKVSPDNPVSVGYEGHGSTVNSKALELAGITKDTPDPFGGKIDKDPETNEPTGYLYERASAPVRALIPPYSLEQTKEGLRKVFQQFLEWGTTTVYDAGVSPLSIRAYQELLAAGEMPVRVGMMIRAGAREKREEFLDCLTSVGFQSGYGNDWLRIIGAKMGIDASGFAGSAAVYTPQHLGTKGLGILVTAPEDLNRMVMKAHKAGLRVCIHAIGDRGIDLALDAIEAAQKEHPVDDMRHRIEHNSLCTPKQMDRLKSLGVVPSSSIGYMWGIGDNYIDNFGPERTRWLHPHRSLIDRGIIAGGNSDYGVCTGDTSKQLYTAVTRRTMTGRGYDYRECITPLEAIRTYTWNGAYSGKEEELKGSIEPGKLADMVVLDKDILTCPEEEIKDFRVLTTIVGGEIKYQMAE